jgi:hypothetical protein
MLAVPRNDAGKFVHGFAQLPLLGRVVRLKGHVEDPGPDHHSEQGLQIAAHVLVAGNADQQSHDHDMDQALHILPVVNGAHAGNKAQQKRQSGRYARIRDGTRHAVAALCKATDLAPCKARPRAEARAVLQPRANALRSTGSHRLRGGTLHRAAFRTRGNTQWPVLLDDSRSSLLTPSIYCTGPRPQHRDPDRSIP